MFVGGAKDIGSSLTRLCFRQRSVENQLKAFTKSVLATCTFYACILIFFTAALIARFFQSLVALRLFYQLDIVLFLLRLV